MGKALNGLVKASQLFQDYLSGILTEKLGFKACLAQRTLLRNASSELSMVIHVDDPMTTGPDETTIRSFFGHLAGWLKTKLGDAMGANAPTRYLGALYWRRGDTIIESTGTDYINDMIKLAGVDKGKTMVTPSVRKADGVPLRTLGPAEHRLFRRFVGKAQYALPRRPDLLYATKELSRKLASPDEGDMTAVKRMGRYLRGAQNMALHLQLDGDLSRLVGRSDSDWGGCKVTRKSTSCGMVSWG